MTPRTHRRICNGMAAALAFTALGSLVKMAGTVRDLRAHEARIVDIESRGYLSHDKWLERSGVFDAISSLQEQQAYLWLAFGLSLAGVAFFRNIRRTPLFSNLPAEDDGRDDDPPPIKGL